MELLGKLQKPICRTVSPSLAASLEPLDHSQNVASLSLFCKYYFGGCSSELAELVPLPYSRGRSTRHFDILHDFYGTIPRRYKDVYVNSFFPRTARLLNFLFIECLPLTAFPQLNIFGSQKGIRALPSDKTENSQYVNSLHSFLNERVSPVEKDIAGRELHPQNRLEECIFFSPWV